MTKLTILGSGTSVSSFYHPFDFRYPSGYLLQHNNKNYLVDCSEGIRQRLEYLKIDYFNIDTIFISHFHPDHFNVETFIHSQMVRNYYKKTGKNLTVYGPPELSTRLEQIWDAKENPGHFRNKLPKFLNLKIVEYKNEERIEIDNFSVTPYVVVHGNMPAYALRFDIEGKTLAYSGDTGPCQEIEITCQKADLFVCEANEKIGDNNPGHLSANQVGEISKRNKVKNVVLTHLTGIHSDEELKKAAEKTGFKGKIKIASDFMEITL